MIEHIKKPARRIGPGTVAMFIGIGAFGLYSYMSQPSTPDRIYYESDNAGKLVRVERPAVSSHKPPQLFKPEPKWLLDRADSLKLSAGQREAVAKVHQEWSVSKRQFERRFQSQADQISVRAKKSSSTPQLQESLGDYSALSREFDRQRSEAWRRSVEILSAQQRKGIAALVEANR